MPTPKELRSRRIAMRLTTAEFAKLLGVSPATLDAWERGDEPIDDATLLERLADVEKQAGPSKKRAQHP